jgi:carboxylesterase type B
MQLSSNNPWSLWMGVKHGDELEFTFGHPLNKLEGGHSYKEDERQLSLKIMKYFTEFAKTGYFVFNFDCD